jgi:membrane-bound serine protease (ClpP class)
LGDEAIMSEIGLLVLIYLVAVLMLVAEIFIPSHGLLTITGIGFLMWALVKTFLYGGQTAGTVAVLSSLVMVPAFIFLSIKYWPHTPIGRRIAPPNPVVTVADTSVPAVELSRFVGRTGRTVSPLRPVGICDFDGRRVSCIVEMGMLDAGENVVATRVVGANLGVSPLKA